MAMVLLPEEELEALIRRALEPLRAEVQRLQADRSRDPVPIPDAARRLGVTVRSVNRWIRDGKLKTVPMGGLRFVLLPGATVQE